MTRLRLMIWSIAATLLGSVAVVAGLVAGLSSAPALLGLAALGAVVAVPVAGAVVAKMTAGGASRPGRD